MAEKTALSPELHAIDRQYERDVRILEARPLLRRIGFFTLITIEVLAAIFFVFVVLGYVINGAFAELRAAGVAFGANRDEFHAIAQANDAQALNIGSARLVLGTPTSYDFYAKVTNTNTDWFATFTYTFSASGVVIEPQEGFVMPGEEVYILALGVDAAQKPTTPAVTIENIVWSRVNRHIAPNIDEWMQKRNAFTISEQTYTKDIDLGTTTFGRTTFTVTNATPYAYWSPQFTVILERAGAIVGIARATVPEFDAGEVRPVEVRWYGDAPVTATVTVVPSINYFDGDGYMPPRGTPGEDIRDSVVL